VNGNIFRYVFAESVFVSPADLLSAQDIRPKDVRLANNISTTGMLQRESRKETRNRAHTDRIAISRGELFRQTWPESIGIVHQTHRCVAIRCYCCFFVRENNFRGYQCPRQWHSAALAHPSRARTRGRSLTDSMNEEKALS